jgi:hypothetical protein
MADDLRLVAAGLSLHADVVTVEVVSRFRQAAIEPILLRGPTLARWLYHDLADRTYIDVDLLVRRIDVARAEAILSVLEFQDRTVAGVIAGDRPAYAHTWVRPSDGATVDLHYTLHGIGAPPDIVFEAFFRGQTEPFALGPLDVTALRPPGRAFVVALHAAAHGAGVGKPLNDLRRALEQVPVETWQESAALAGQLQAREAFATGLRLFSAGEEIAESLGLSGEASTETVLRAATPPPMALGFEWLARTPGGWQRARLVVRKSVPSPSFMRAWSPLAARGKMGLLMAYVYRLAWLAQHSVPGLVAWLRARRSTR